MNIKKMMALVLALLMVLSLAACGSDAGNDTQNPGSSGNNAQPGGNQENPGNTGGETETQPGGSQQGGSDYPVLKEITVEALADYPVAPEGDFLYDISDSGNGIAIHTYTGSNEIVVIPDTIDGKVVEQIGNLTFANESTVRAVVIPETVTELKEVFANNVCVEVIIARGVTHIKESAFLYCPNLHTVELSDQIVEIGVTAFCFCSSLKELHISSTLTEMTVDAQASAFTGCDNLTIYGEAGSFIETVCSEQNIPFAAE